MGIDVDRNTLRIIIFWIITAILGFINFRYLQFHNVWLELLIRIPQAYSIGLIYHKYIKKEPMKTRLTKYKMKTIWQYILFAFGFVEYILFVILERVIHFSYNPDLKTAKMLFLNFINESAIIIILSIIITLPIYYFYYQTIILIRIFTVWIFNNRPKYFPLFLGVEEAFFVCWFTFLIN
jgi:hypothetical protein